MIMKALLATIALLLAIRLAVAGDPLPKGWSPSLDAAREWLEGDLDNAPQQGMNRITGALGELADAELAIVFLRLYANLPVAEQKKLQAEQRRWLKLRNKAAEDAVESHGGSLAPTEANLGFTAFTRKRIAELQKRLERVLASENARE